MQQDSNKKKGKGYRVRPAFARERLNGRTRRVCSILGLAAVVLASAVVVHSLYVIQIRDGAKYRQYAAQQQLLDTTVKAALRRRRESGRGGHFLGGIHPAIPDRVRCTVQN